MPDSLIVTISDDTNYGNRLQNYALSRLLSNYGNSTTAHFYLGINSSGEYRAHRIKQALHLSSVKHLIEAIIHPNNLDNKRMKRMRLFTASYVPNDKFEFTGFNGLRPKNDNRYQIVVLGSDQIWNPNFMSREELELHLGMSFTDSVKVISYAASFGLSSIEDESARLIFQKYLPKIAHISVREDAGQKLVKTLADCDASVVLDPTLMITAQQWLSITHSFVSTEDRYVLTYFLGEPSAEQQACINEYAGKQGCRIRRILDSSDSETYVAGPEDFVELFSKAQYVFTDSYHACCFSLLFNKQFTVFTRAGFTKQNSMNSRMETLFRLFELDTVVSESELAPRIDYSRVNALLEKHRQESRAWLDAAMGR